MPSRPKNRQRIIDRIFSLIAKREYEQARILHESQAEILGDPLDIRTVDGNELVAEMIRRGPALDYTLWLLDSIVNYNKPLPTSGTYVLDYLIPRYNPAAFPEKLLNDITERTLVSAVAYDKEYYYDYDMSDEMANLEGFVSRLYAHHETFRKYLERTPLSVTMLQKHGVDTDFWMREISAEEFRDECREANDELGESLGSLTSLRSKEDDEDSPPFARHAAEQAPTIAEYRDASILQLPVARKLSGLLARSSFARSAAPMQMKINDGARFHMIFNGPPGTGKTTLSRTLGRYMKDIGLLQKGHVVETTATGLTAKYIGHTADNVRRAVEAAIGGILFIDEIYHFYTDDRFGPEGVHELLAQMENRRGEFLLVIAGYEDENEKFLKMNPGLKDRFGITFYFDHFNREQLEKILAIKTNAKGLTMDKNASDAMVDYLEYCKAHSPQSYSNARSLENFLELVVTAHAEKLCDGDGILYVAPDQDEETMRDFLTLKKEDVEKALADMRRDPAPRRTIGYAPSPT